jgi:hypothetical protein
MIYERLSEQDLGEIARELEKQRDLDNSPVRDLAQKRGYRDVSEYLRLVQCEVNEKANLMDAVVERVVTEINWHKKMKGRSV